MFSASSPKLPLFYIDLLKFRHQSSHNSGMQQARHKATRPTAGTDMHSPMRDACCCGDKPVTHGEPKPSKRQSSSCTSVRFLWKLNISELVVIDRKRALLVHGCRAASWDISKKIRASRLSWEASGSRFFMTCIVRLTRSLTRSLLDEMPGINRDPIHELLSVIPSAARKRAWCSIHAEDREEEHEVVEDLPFLRWTACTHYQSTMLEHASQLDSSGASSEHLSIHSCK